MRLRHKKTTKAFKRFTKLFSIRGRKRLVRYSLLSVNILLLGSAAFLVIHSQQTTTGSNAAQQNSLANIKTESSPNPLDKLSSADIAVNVARLSRLDEATSVTNRADTVNAEIAIAPSDDKLVAKPQVVATANKSKKDIKTHVVASGESISSIAAKYGVTSDNIRWSNGVNGDAVAVGKELVIPPVIGIVYTVKDGDTPEKLADRYRASKDSIITFNDAEISGLKVGERIVIPDGSVQQVVRSIAGAGGYSGAFTAIYGFNGYDYGYCTWWVAVRRSQIGRPIPSNLGNASTWKVLAQRAGFGVGNTPAAGAVIWYPPQNYYGHVGFVESVDPDGTAHISEMNVIGWNRVSYKTLSPQQTGAYSYIY